MKKRMIIVSCIILGCLLSQPIAANQSRLEQILPENMEIDGWLPEDEPIIATDEETLSMIINGAAQRFFELGVQKAVFITYEKGDIYLILEIYETDSVPAAEKVFNEFETRNSQPLQNIGSDSRFTSEMGGSYMAEYIQNRFYVKLSITQKSEDTKVSILTYAKAISDNILKFKNP